MMQKVEDFREESSETLRSDPVYLIKHWRKIYFLTLSCNQGCTIVFFVCGVFILIHLNDHMSPPLACKSRAYFSYAGLVIKLISSWSKLCPVSSCATHCTQYYNDFSLKWQVQRRMSFV